MKKVRLSPTGKGLLYVFGMATFGMGAGFGIVTMLVPDAPTETAAPPPGGINALVTEFSAAVTAEAQAKLAEQQASAGKPAVVRATCADVSAMMNQLSSNSGISSTITVTPYYEPTSYFEFGYCELKVGRETITFFNDGDELTDEHSRRYIINELIENLPADDVLKIHTALTGGAKAPQP